MSGVDKATQKIKAEPQMSPAKKLVRKFSNDSDNGSPSRQHRARRSSLDTGDTSQGLKNQGKRGSIDSGVKTPGCMNQGRRCSIDSGVKTPGCMNQGRRGSVDYVNGLISGFDRRRRRSSVDFEKQKLLLEELAKRKPVQTVRMRRHSIQLQHDVTKRLSQGLSQLSLEDEYFQRLLNKFPGKIDECLTKDPNLREDQVKVILQSFSTLDENGDGRISKREIARAYRLAGFNPTKKEVEEIVLEHDDNDDGYIDFEEYFNVMRTKMIKMDFEKERLKTAFKVLDTDQDGFITRDELKHALSKTGDRFSEEEIKDIIQKADKNLDGKIDYNEFVEADLCKTVF